MIQCEKCGEDTKVGGVWSFPKYIARKHDCKSCGHSFETFQDLKGNRHEDVSAFEDHAPITPLVDKLVEKATGGRPYVRVPADTTAQPDNEDPLDAKLRALGYNG